LAEDNPGDVQLVQEALREHHLEFDLVVCSDGARALSYLENVASDAGVHCPDVFLLDLNLPKASGHQILEKFRTQFKCSDTPVIVVTSSDAPRDRERAAQLGAAHYFRKPTDFEEFMKLGAVIKSLTSR
jgi:CheY-like chemotaxis protein